MKENNYFTHGIHPYHAKFIPAIPKEFLDKYGKAGDIVLDPFCGSGTTLLECAISGHESYGVDLSDIAIKISKAKTFIPDIEALDVLFKKIKDDYAKKEEYEETIFPDKYIWYTRETASVLDRLLSSIRDIKDEDYRNVFEVLFSSILKTVSNKRETWNNGYIADNVLPNKPYTGDAFKVFCSKYKLMKKAYIDLKQHCEGLDYKKPKVYQSNILNFETKVKFDMVITSPPYPFAVDFIRYNRLTYYWFNWDIEERFKEETGSRGKRSRKKALDEFFKEMEVLYKHNFQLVRKGGYFCMTVGNTARDNNKISFVDWLIKLFADNGWNLVSNEERTILAQSMAQKRIPTEQKLVFKKYDR